MSDKKLFEDFGLDDLAEEHSDNRAGKIVLAVFLFAMWAALAWTTAEFFAAFGSQLGQRFGQLAPLFAAAFGVLTIDVAYSAWLYAGKEQADTTAQRIAAIGTAVVLFLISLIVTGVYMMLTGDLREGVIDAQMTDTLKVAGIAILAASTVVNGIGLMLWAVLGHGWRKAAFYSKMRAVLYEEAASIDEQRAKLTAAARREWLKAQMPDAASQRGIQAGGQYMERAQLAATSRPAPVRDTTSGAQRSESLQQLMAMLANVNTTDGMYDLLDNYHRDINRLSPSDYELWHQAQQERHNLLAQYGRLDEFGADGGQQAGAEQARRLSRFHTIYSDEHGDVATRPTNGRNGAH